MEIKDLQKERNQLEDRISEFVKDQLSEFIAKTGVDVLSVYINLTDMREMSNPNFYLVLVATDVRLKV